MKTTLTLLLSLLLVSPTRGENDYMKGKIVPNFKVLNSDEGFEKREYDATTWLRVKVKSAEPSDFIEASGQLKSFVEEAKKNTKGLDNLDKTWPVLINHTKENQLWLSWFVPPGKQPSSGNSLVEIFNLPKSTFFVWKFTGSPSIKAGKENANKLLSRLGRECPNLDLVDYSGAGYESFWSTVHNNEVWISEHSSCALAG